MCDLQPSFKYVKEQREQFREEAAERREHAIQYRIDELNETREKAEYLNRPKNHFMGVISERAVGKWLDDEGVRYTVPDNMYLEILRKIPDITTEL